jgi:integrase
MPAKSTGRGSRGKPSPKSGVITPARPRRREKFPLSIHKGTGYWCKKIRGRVYYFGRVADDPKGVAAEERWLREKDDLYAGREPRDPNPKAMTVEELCFRFLEHKEGRVRTGELNPRTFRGYVDTCKGMAEIVGRKRAVADLKPDDFDKLRAKLAETRAAVALGNEVMRIRSVFKYGFKNDLIPHEVKYGSGFGKPDPKVALRERRMHREEHGDRMFEPAQIRQILGHAGQPLRAMVLLGANCGFGQSDVANLPREAVDLDGGWVDFPRPKTEVDRRCWLWPETVEAIRDWLPLCPRPKDPADTKLLFLTVRGSRWIKVCKARPAKVEGEQKPGGAPKDAVGQEFNKVLKALNLKRSRLSFYALRHGFETFASETADQVAVDRVMGHKTPGMSGVYTERIGDDRLRRISEHVRARVFGDGLAGGPSDGEPVGTAPEICDPCGPCDPTQENAGKNGVASLGPGRTGSQAGSQGVAGATRENPGKTWARVAGSHGSQVSAPVLTAGSDRPALKLFAG